MSEIRSFISENELEEARKTRQAEWERVRKPDEPLEAPEPDQDNRCLYERLKEQREKKQAELEEAHKLKHMVRGLDSEEIGFLDVVDEMKAAEEKKRRLEEKALIEQINKARESETLSQEPAASSSKKPTPPKTKSLSKQAQLISAGIKRKSSGSDKNEASPPHEKRTKIAQDTSPAINETHSISSVISGSTSNSLKTVGLRPTAIRQIGILPGLVGSTGTICSSSSSNSSDSSDDEDFLNKMKLKAGVGGTGGKQQIAVEIKNGEIVRKRN